MVLGNMLCARAGTQTDGRGKKHSRNENREEGFHSATLALKYLDKTSVPVTSGDLIFPDQSTFISLFGSWLVNSHCQERSGDPNFKAF